MQDPEAPAKNYQVLELSNAVSRMESKLDNSLKNQFTASEAEYLRMAFDEKLKSARREIDLEYGPLASNVRWFSRTIIVTFLVMMGNIAVTVLLILSKGK